MCVCVCLYGKTPVLVGRGLNTSQCVCVCLELLRAGALCSSSAREELSTDVAIHQGIVKLHEH